MSLMIHFTCLLNRQVVKTLPKIERFRRSLRWLYIVRLGEWRGKEGESMNRIVNEISQKFKEKLLSEIPDKVLRIIIFGSYARGEETMDSDLDILVVITEKSKKLEKRIFDIAYEIMWEHNFTPLISLEIMTEEQWQLLKKKNSSFYRNIQKEGIIL